MKAVVRGIGAVGGFGCGVRELRKALSGTRPAGSRVDIDAPGGVVRVPGLLADTGPLSDFVPLRALRRMDHHTRTAVLAGFLALQDADMLSKQGRGRMGIVVATGFGATCNNFDFQKLSHDDSDFIGSPMVFINSVHNAAAAYIAMALKENGPNHTVSQYDMSFTSALITAILWLRENRVDTVLVGGLDDFSHAGAFDLHGRNLELKNRGSGPSRDGSQDLMVGEGACFLVLSGHPGEPDGYGYIDGLHLGKRLPGPDGLPHAQAYIAPRDCIEKNRDLINDMIPSNTRLGSCTHIVGLMPVGEAFDLAVSALCLKHRNWYPSMIDLGIPGNPKPNDISHSNEFAGPSICCFKFGTQETFSWFRIQNNTGCEAKRVSTLQAEQTGR